MRTKSRATASKLIKMMILRDFERCDDLYGNDRIIVKNDVHKAKNIGTISEEITKNTDQISRIEADQIAWHENLTRPRATRLNMKKSLDDGKTTELPWWAYILMILGLFLLCLLLNYIMKKINEVRLEKRFSKVLGKKSPDGYNVDSSRYVMLDPEDLNKITKKKNDSEHAISMIFTKEDNITSKIGGDRKIPNKGDDIIKESSNLDAAYGQNENNKGIKLVSSENLNDKTPKHSDSNDLLVKEDSKRVHSICSLINLSGSNINHTLSKLVPDETFSIVEEKTETMTNSSSIEKSAVNEFKAKLLLDTTDDVKSTSRHSITKDENIDSREKTSAHSLDKPFYSRFLGSIYSNTKKSESVTEKIGSNNESASKITLNQQRTASDKTLGQEMKESVGNSSYTTIETPVNADKDSAKDLRKYNIDEEDATLDTSQSCPCDMESEALSNSKGGNMSDIIGPLESILDLPSKMAKVFEAMGKNLADEMTYLKNSVARKPSTATEFVDYGSTKENNQESELEKNILSKESVHKDSLMLKNDSEHPSYETESEPQVYTDPGHRSESQNQFVDNVSKSLKDLEVISSKICETCYVDSPEADGSLLDTMNTKSYILKKPGGPSTTASETKLKGVGNNLNANSPTNSVRAITSGKVINYSDTVLENNATEILNKSAIPTPDDSADTLLMVQGIVELMRKSTAKHDIADMDAKD